MFFFFFFGQRRDKRVEPIIIETYGNLEMHVFSLIFLSLYLCRFDFTKLFIQNYARYHLIIQNVYQHLLLFMYLSSISPPCDTYHDLGVNPNKFLS